MKAHDWVGEVEQHTPTETVGRETGGEASPGQDENEENKEIGQQQEVGKEIKEGEDTKEETEPRSVQVSSSLCDSKQHQHRIFLYVCVWICVCALFRPSTCLHSAVWLK